MVNTARPGLCVLVRLSIRIIFRCNQFGLVHISTGDLLRAQVSAGTDIGKRAKEFMNSGSLVPDEIVIAEVRERDAIVESLAVAVGDDQLQQ
ncbi:PREDICTED: adenylate kinase 5, chloroplastic-like [Camelina sativa]|uniref:adenylate kinase n=1 Tax=Camelina sativa TaxID=90675 RepID=A0ABM0YSL3_CAMSA|nr:PREDICTED: adenylate kinase 5, chloroplastic-like [Camelina sativa]